MPWRMLIAVFCLAGSIDVFAATIQIAVAANFSGTLEKIICLYRSQHPESDVVVSVASSGALALQIQHGAPYDIFLSADDQQPRQLLAQGIGRQTDIYARGKLVLYFLNGERIAQWPQGKYTLAIANPLHAPYGRAAREVMTNLNAQPQKLVQGNSVLQAMQFARTGNAEFALVARSMVGDDEHWMQIDDELYSPILQGALLISNRLEAEQFYQFLLSEPVQELLVENGYGAANE